MALQQSVTKFFKRKGERAENVTEPKLKKTIVLLDSDTESEGGGENPLPEEPAASTGNILNVSFGLYNQCCSSAFRSGGTPLKGKFHQFYFSESVQM